MPDRTLDFAGFMAAVQKLAATVLFDHSVIAAATAGTICTSDSRRLGTIS